MSMSFINAVVTSIVKASDNVSSDAVLILNQEVRNGGTVGNESGLDAISEQPVFAVLVGAFVCGLLGLGPRQTAEEEDGLVQQLHCDYLVWGVGWRSRTDGSMSGPWGLYKFS